MLMSMLEFIKSSKIKMIKKILILLPIIALSACATAKTSQEIKTAEKKCDYYNNTENNYNENLLKKYKEERSAFIILEDKMNSCFFSDCNYFASNKNWDYIEIELNGDPNDINNFPRNGDSGLYKMSRDFNMYEKFNLIRKDPTSLKTIKMSCDNTDNCVSCSSGLFCIVASKINTVTSDIKIKKTLKEEKHNSYSSTLINYNVKINDTLFFEYNTYIYSTKTQYSSFSSSICSNNKNIQPLLIEILGGYRSE